MLGELCIACDIQLRSSPTKALEAWPSKDPEAWASTDLMCFPWAVVEAKHGRGRQGNAEFCYCQAANASAAALRLREQLAVKADGSRWKQNLPVIAFTCVGSRIKLWLTYREGESGQVVTHCVLAEGLVAN